jgi:hypothetical protein
MTTVDKRYWLYNWWRGFNRFGKAPNCGSDLTTYLSHRSTQQWLNSCRIRFPSMVWKKHYFSTRKLISLNHCCSSTNGTMGPSSKKLNKTFFIRWPPTRFFATCFKLKTDTTATLCYPERATSCTSTSDLCSSHRLATTLALSKPPSNWLKTT